MQSLMFGTALMAAMVSLTAGQALFFGTCPAQTVVQNFDINQYLGKWFENQKYFAFFEAGGKCITATYTDKGPNKVGVVNYQVNKLTNNPKTIEGEATLVDPASNEAKLSVSFGGGFGNFGSSNDGNYWVLDTDYTTYSIVWSCSSFKFFNAQILWILTRERKPNAQVVNNARQIIENRGLKVSKLMVTDQDNCP